MDSITITNSAGGVISGADYAIYNEVYTTGMTLDNARVINGDILNITAAQIEADEEIEPLADNSVLSDTITNTSVINGDIELGLGDDSFDSSLGTHNGVVTSDDGDDTIILGAGDNEIHGGSGINTLTDGGGADIFQVHSDENGHDTITDFTPGVDDIDLSDFALQGQVVFGPLTNNSGFFDIDIQVAGSDLEVTIDLSDDGAADHTLILQGLGVGDIAAVQDSFTLADAEFIPANTYSVADLNALDSGVQEELDILEVGINLKDDVSTLLPEVQAGLLGTNQSYVTSLQFTGGNVFAAPDFDG